MSSEAPIPEDVQPPVFSLEQALQGQLPYFKGQVELELGRRAPQLVFGDPEFEKNNMLIAATTNEVVAKVAGGFMKIHEPRSAYDTFLWARHLSTQLLGHPPDIDAKCFSGAYQGMPADELLDTSNEYFKGRLSLQNLSSWCVARIDLRRQYLRSAHVIAGITFKLIEQREAETLAVSLHDFQSQLAQMSSDDFIARLSGPQK
ncbi:MAG: hypothetical protein JWP13_966 [Candidatus Saccharibacteria bacterium]|nr:hypothetical protein [Candidatus Saccharibacteria bacterium]